MPTSTLYSLVNIRTFQSKHCYSILVNNLLAVVVTFHCCKHCLSLKISYCLQLWYIFFISYHTFLNLAMHLASSNYMYLPKTGIYHDHGYAEKTIWGSFLMLSLLHVVSAFWCCVLMVFEKCLGVGVLVLCVFYLKPISQNGYFSWLRSCGKSDFGLIFDVNFFACELLCFPDRCLKGV